MRFLWIEDCDGGNSTQMSDIKKWKEYFGIEKEKRLTTLEDTLEFLEIKENWKKFDAVLIDIRFPICKSDNIDEFCVFKKYFDNIITKEKFDEYAHSVEGFKQNASSGILLYLALVFRYNLPQSKIAFISANIDGTGVGLSPLRTMKEYIYKAKARETLSEDEICEFEDANGNLLELYFDNSEEDFNFETTDKIKWDSEEEGYFIRLICKLTEIERKLTKKFENKKLGLKYNSVKEEFKKIGLVIPQGFEKPGQESDKSLIKKSWCFDDWKKSINDEYSIIRTNIIVMCSSILGILEEKGEEESINEFIQPYKSIVKDKKSMDEYICDLKYYLNSIIECLPITYWANSDGALLQMYKRLSREIISIFDNINIPEKLSIIKYAKCKVLKICRNWMAHNCISNINSRDIVFIFLLAMSSLFDVKYIDDSCIYYKSEEELITMLGNIDEFEFSRNFKKLNNEKEKYITKCKDFIDNFKGDIKNKIFKSYKDELEKKDKEIMNIISAIGSEYNSEKQKVSITDLEKCFLICLYENESSNVAKCKTEEKTLKKIEALCFSLFID
jgi:hypothetical protein